METLNSLIENLRSTGVNVDDIMSEVDQEHHDLVLSMVQEREAFHPLVEAVRRWTRAYEYMQKEWDDWHELNRMDC